MTDTIHIAWHASRSTTGMSLRDFLRVEKQMSRKLLAEVKYEGGELLVNGNTADVRYRLAEGDQIEVVFPPEKTSANIVPVKKPLTIVYEDDHVLLLEKPAGCPVLPMSDRLKPSLAGAVLAYYQTISWPATVHIVTRLDKDTTGLVLIAKHRYAHSLLTAAQQNGSVYREYEAVVRGSFSWEAVSIHAPIGRRAGSIVEQKVSKHGKRAVTHAACLTRSEEESRLAVRIETGRTHQIRVHLAWLGYPLAGESLYAAADKRPAHALQARKIVFPHPYTEQIIAFEAENPLD
ncbi:RluA family pseudouridine synthase [Alkalicoccus luteus]|uniref:Pseudouridine synthase n=1 Tax=Alkalicoccus luteus TaxID=1237094 RepID=A0A969TW78_9BACI|nr:RluA family pseudouridine synthase [Alkalicoccus luteus]NJP39160.1 RluA family pseudouridine synthase [Alkalicoccus luteus]